MSWNINIVGSRAAVKAAIAKEQYIPQGLKDVVNSICDTNAKTGSPLISVETYGHFDTAWGGNVGKFEVKQVQLAPEPPPPAPATTEGESCEACQ